MGFGFTFIDYLRLFDELFGGWRMWVVLVCLLFVVSDLLVFDELINYFDVDSVIWLENHLVGWRIGFLFVSYDWDFIDVVVNWVLELSGSWVIEYVGGFVEFVVVCEECFVD